jgi:DNA-directed RNA polymerase beta' subunit
MRLQAKELTVKYREITRVNNELSTLQRGIHVEQSNHDGAEVQVDPYIHERTRKAAAELQWHIATLLNHKLRVPLPPPRNFQSVRIPTTSMKALLMGREGFFRAWNSRQVEYTARGVLVCADDLHPADVLLPQELAMNLTIPEQVHHGNIAELRRLVMNGPHQLEGANSVTWHDGRTIDLRFAEGMTVAQSITADAGVIVMRHLREGDVVLLNRQPSDELSFMAHKVKLWKRKCIGLHGSVMKAYGADCDGDDINVHVLQSVAARTEAWNLMSVEQRLLSPHNGEPVVLMEHDQTLGCFTMTQACRYIVLATVRACMASTPTIDYTRYNEPPVLMYRHRSGKWTALRTGKQLFSVSFPRTLHYNTHLPASVMVPSSHPSTLQELHALRASTIAQWEADDALLILDGRLLGGTVDRHTAGLLLIAVTRQFDNSTALAWLDAVSRQVSAFLAVDEGFSTSAEDFQVCTRATKSKFTRGLLAVSSSCSPAVGTQEAELNSLVDFLHLGCGEAALAQLAAGGSRVSMMLGAGGGDYRRQIAQLLVGVGQQYQRGENRLNGLDNDRLTPHFPMPNPAATHINEASPTSSTAGLQEMLNRGMVLSTFRDGLSSVDMAHHMCGRIEGLSQTYTTSKTISTTQTTSARTAITYISQHDLSVRDTDGNIVQLLYGEDGMDPQLLTPVDMDIVKCSRDEIVQSHSAVSCAFTHLWTLEQAAQPSGMGLDDVESLVVLLEREMEELWELITRVSRFEAFQSMCGVPMRYKMPVDIKSVLLRRARKQQDNSTPASNDSSVPCASEVWRTVNAFIEKLYAQYPAAFNRNLPFELLLRSTLCVRNVVLVFQLTRYTLDGILSEIATKFFAAFLPAGKLVGIMATQYVAKLFTTHATKAFTVDGLVPAASVDGGAAEWQRMLSLRPSKHTNTMSIVLLPYDQCRSLLSPEQISFVESSGAESARVSMLPPEVTGNERRFAQLAAGLLLGRSLKDIVTSVEVVSILSEGDAIWMHHHGRPGSAENRINACGILLVIRARDCETCGRCIEDIATLIRQAGRGRSHVRKPKGARRKPQLVLPDTDESEDVGESDEKNSAPDDIESDCESAHPIPTPAHGQETNGIIVSVSPLQMPQSSETAHWILRVSFHRDHRQVKSICKQIPPLAAAEYRAQLLASRLLQTLRVSGISSVTQCRVGCRSYDDAGVCRTSRMVIHTSGSDLCAALQYPFVDPVMSISHEPRDMVNTFGIVAMPTALQSMYGALFRQQGYDVDFRHIAILASINEHDGKLIGRYSKSKHEQTSSACHQLTGSDPLERLLAASTKGAADPLRGTAESLMFGKTIPSGTGGVVMSLLANISDVAAASSSSTAVAGPHRHDARLLLGEISENSACSEYEGCLFRDDGELIHLPCNPARSQEVAQRTSQKRAAAEACEEFRTLQSQFKKQMKYKLLLQSSVKQFHNLA